MGVPFFFGVAEAIFVGIYCMVCWKIGWTKAPADASLWRAMVTSYEVLEAERVDTAEISLSTDSSQSGEMKKGDALHTYFAMMEVDHPGLKTPSGEFLT